MQQLFGHKARVRCLAYAPDGRVLASGGADGTLRLWDRVTGDSETLFGGRGKPLHAVTFSRDGCVLAWGLGTDVIVWGYRGRAFLSTLPGRLGAVKCLSLTPDGRLLVASTQVYWARALQPGEIRCWEVATGRQRNDLLRPLYVGLGPGIPASRAWSTALSPDGTTLAEGTRYGVGLNDWPACTHRARLVQGSSARMIAFAPDGLRLATVSRGVVVNLWTAIPPYVVRPLVGHAQQARCLAFSPDSAILASGGNDGLVIFWDPASARERARYDWRLGPVHALAFAPDGMTLAVGAEKGIAICDVEGV